MTRMTKRKEQDREYLENALMSTISAAKSRLPHIALRVEQAKRRSGLADLLDPALQELDDVSKKLTGAADDLAKLWERDWK